MSLEPQPIVLCPRCRRPLRTTHVRPSYPPLPGPPPHDRIHGVAVDVSSRPFTITFEPFPGGAGRRGDMTGQINYSPCVSCTRLVPPSGEDTPPAIEWPREDVIE